KRSASLPQMGVEIAVVSSVAVMTQVNAVWSPWRSLMMTGSELETTVDASIDTNMPRMRPERASSTRRCSFFSAGASGDAGVDDMRILKDGRFRADARRRWRWMVERSQPLRGVNDTRMVDRCQRPRVDCRPGA